MSTFAIRCWLVSYTTPIVKKGTYTTERVVETARNKLFQFNSIQKKKKNYMYPSTYTMLIIKDIWLQFRSASELLDIQIDSSSAGAGRLKVSE